MRQWLVCLCLLLIGVQAAQAEGPQVRAALTADAQELRPNEPFWAGVTLTIAEGWHVYWQNPGDSGLEVMLDWRLPPGMSAGPIHWPAPKRIDYGGLFNYGYEGEVTLLVPLTPPPDWDAQPFELGVKADWLVCKDICIPESAELNLTVTPGETVADFTAALERLPQIWPEAARYRAEDKQVAITVPLEKAGVRDLDKVWWFPIDDGIITNASDQFWRVEGYDLILRADRGGLPLKPEFRGVLSIAGADGEARHWQVSAQGEGIAAPPAAAEKPVALDPPKNESGDTLWIALLSAFLGGLILNIMPCVLPILSLKALSIAKKAASEPARVRRMGVAYTAGVLISFAAIAAALIALQQAGESVGWGFQLQSPLFVVSLIYILFLVGLNLSGLFELPVLLGGVSAGRDDQLRGSFFTGVLATIVATPCTAPFMATALGFALGQPPALALLIFLSLGLGLAFPFLLISFIPRLHRLLPKPGAWMLRFKQFLAFPIYASVAWLLWVLVQQTGPMGLALAFAGLLLIAFAAWALPLLRRHARWIAVLILLPLIALTMAEQSSEPVAQNVDATDTHAPFSMQRLNELRVQGTPVFVNATAAWCITCKVNERVALRDASVEQAFKEAGIVTLVADWTNRDAEITAYLASFGRSGVPIYVYYPAHGEPRILPQLLTPEIVRDAIAAGS